MTKPIFITGTGTGVGKTVVAAIVAEALQADYWKPIQTGDGDERDSDVVGQLVSNSTTRIHFENYKLPVSATDSSLEKTNTRIDLEVLERSFRHLSTVNPYLVIEGAGGLLVPLNENEYVIDLIEKLDARVIIVSRNYPGSINHALLTAQLCRQRNLEVLGWVFNEVPGDQEEQVISKSGFPSIGRLPQAAQVDKTFIERQASLISNKLQGVLDQPSPKKPSRKNKLSQE